MDPHVPGPGFPGDADAFVRLAGQGEAYFGRNVLRGLVAGLREAANRPRSHRWWGPGVLGCAMWMDDPELIQVLSEMANVCIVLTKQPKQNLERAKAKPLWELAKSSGLAQAAYYELFEYAPRDGSGRPLIVGPGTSGWTEETQIGAVREVGFRKVGGQLVPIVHAKMALLGRMGWTDEDPLGGVSDDIFFSPQRLWISSANFTESSRSGLEIGLWTDDSDLMAGARRFLLGLIALSEPLGTGPDTLDPELLPIEYDNEAMAAWAWEEHRDRDEDYEDW